MCPSKSAFHRKVGECSSSTTETAVGERLEERRRNYRDEHSPKCASRFEAPWMARQRVRGV